MTLEISVPGGTGVPAGFAIQRSSHGLGISGGSLFEAQVGFGITNDAAGLGVRVGPFAGAGFRVDQMVRNLHDDIGNLRSYITVERISGLGGGVTATVCEHLFFMWWMDNYFPGHANVITDGSAWMELTWPGCGALSIGFYRLTIFWDEYSRWPNIYARALQTVEFEIVGNEEYHYLALPAIDKHFATADEWDMEGW